MLKQVMFNASVADSHYADAHNMVDEGIYTVSSERGGEYEIRWDLCCSALFKKEWFVPVYYSAETPSEEDQLQITDCQGKKTVITPHTVIETDSYYHVYKVYVGECEDFYAVKVR